MTTVAAAARGQSALIPCPKGCDVEYLSVYRLPDSLSRHIYCLKCKWTGPWGNTYAEAKKEWNDRIPTTPLADVEEDKNSDVLHVAVCQAVNKIGVLLADLNSNVSGGYIVFPSSRIIDIIKAELNGEK